MTDYSVDSYFREEDRREAERAEQTDFLRRAEQARLASSGVNAEGEEEDGGWLDFDDVALAIPRGAEGFVRSIGSLVGIESGDDRVFGKSDTFGGALLENIAQFAIGFVPGGFAANALSKLGAVKAASAAMSATKSGKFLMGVNKGATAGAVSDFLSFDGHEENFSALIQSQPALANPLTEFLATDGDDSQVVARIKNVLEGMGLGAAVGSLIESMRGLKAVRKAKADGMEPGGIRDAMKDAVDPGRARDGMADLMNTRARAKDLDEVEPGPVSRDNPGPAAGEEFHSETPQGKDEILEEIGGARLTDDEAEAATDEFMDAYGYSKAARPLPEANPRKLDPEQLVEFELHPDGKNLADRVETKGGAHVYRAVEDLNGGTLKEIGPISEEIHAEAVRMTSELLGLSPEEALQLVSAKARGAADDIRAQTVVSVSINQYMGAMLEGAAQLLDLAIKGDVEAKAKFLKLQQHGFNDALRNMNAVGSEGGRLLRAQQIAFENDGPMAELTAKMLGDSADTEVLMEQMAVAFSEGGLESAAAAEALRKLSFGRKSSKVLYEVFINSILSGPRTISIQGLSGAALAVYLPLEQMLGGALRGDRTAINSAYGELISLTSGFQEAARAAKKTWQTGVSQIDPGRSMRDDPLAGGTTLRRELAGDQSEKLLGSMFHVAGKVVGFPSRLIGTADEFVKQMTARARLRGQFLAEGLEKGMDHAGAAAYADDTLKTVLVDGQLKTETAARKIAIAEGKAQGLTDPAALANYVDANYTKHFDPSRSANMEDALARAQEATLQTPLPDGGFGQKGQAWLDSMTVYDLPLGRFIVPFYRMPLNVAKFVGQRIPIADVLEYGLASKKLRAKAPEEIRSRFLKEMLSDDPTVQANAYGRVAAGIGMMGTASMLAANGLITGRGPQDPDERKALMDAGWMPYSFRTPSGFVQYLRMDPFATFFGLVADTYDVARLADSSEDTDLQEVGTSIMVSLANNFVERSFMQGIGQVIDALSDPQKNMGALVEQYASAVVPNTFGQAMQAFGDDAMVESHGVLERIVSRTPGLGDAIDVQAGVRRNLLGEPLKRTGQAGDDAIGSWVGFIQPIAYREVSSDLIRQELASLRHGFRPPREVQNGVDLREIRNDAGQTAYDRWGELHGKVKVKGKSLRQELTGLMQSNRYKRMSSVAEVGQSERVEAITMIVTRYRQKALREMLEEFPEAASLLAEARQRKAERRAGLRALSDTDTDTIGRLSGPIQ